MSCQVRDEGLIRVGLLAAQSMIEVCDGKYDAQFWSQVPQNLQQGNRVRATRYSDGHTIAGADESSLADITQNRLKHGGIVRHSSRAP
jgi:hypothetical protein